MLRLVGNWFGPVLRNRPPIDRAAAQIEWSWSMDELATRRRTGQVVRDPQRADRGSRNMLNR